MRNGTRTPSPMISPSSPWKGRLQKSKWWSTVCPTYLVTLDFGPFLNKRAIKDKIWWYHWISCWILSMIKYKNLFLAEKITQLWPFSQEASILTNCVWGLILGVCLFMSLMKMLITWLFFQLEKCFYTFPAQNLMRNSVVPSDFIIHHWSVQKTYKNKM